MPEGACLTHGEAGGSWASPTPRKASQGKEKAVGGPRGAVGGSHTPVPSGQCPLPEGHLGRPRSAQTVSSPVILEFMSVRAGKRPREKP